MMLDDEIKLAKKIALAKLVQEGKVPCIDPFFECIFDDKLKNANLYLPSWKTHFLERILDEYIDNDNQCYRMLTLSGDLQETKKRPKLFYYHNGVPTSSFFSKKIMTDAIYAEIIETLQEMYDFLNKLEDDND